MNLLKDKIAFLVEETVKKEFGDIEFQVKIDYPSADAHGDYSVNVAFELGKKLGKASRAIAETLAQKIKLPDWISRVECAGPGFLNFFIAPQFLTDFLQEVIDEGEKFGSSKIAAGKTVVTDTSHPNVAKPMGVHHLLSTIIGCALNKMFNAVGYKVIRDNYLGDYGTQFGKLIYAYKTWGSEETVKKNPIPELLKLYVKFHDEVEKDVALEDRGRAEFKKLEGGDSENRKLWKWIVDLSLQEFQGIYDRLDVSFDYIHGESFYEDKMRAIIDMGIKKGVFVTGEGGALIAPFENEKYPPCLIKKSDGATLYATRDLARTKYWEDTWHPDLMVMVVDVAQSLHFQQFFEVARMLKITKAPNIHVSFGRMSFPEKRMSTRKGNIILLEEVLDEAEERALKLVEEKNPDLSEKQKKAVARQVGIGAMKYAVLSQNRTTDITFTWDKMLSLEGNSAPYLQYVYARARAILRKRGEENFRGGKYILTEPQELALAKLLPKLPEVVVHAAQEFKPNLIANYLFEVAQRFNGFYAAQEVLKAKPEIRAARLKLVEAATVVIKNGLKLLGIEVPEEM
ncbi:arginine--tRNA ligase [Candidatus Peregrinibacteria bacterium]|nr:arginine--tRNA ligase [Candidatus Peregrinibacteria bacterium]